MMMWIRLGGALLITVAVVAALEYFGAGLLPGDRSPEEMQAAAHGRARELFWLLICWAVMATAVLAAVRRWSGHLRRAIATPGRRQQP